MPAESTISSPKTVKVIVSEQTLNKINYLCKEGNYDRAKLFTEAIEAIPDKIKIKKPSLSLSSILLSEGMNPGSVKEFAKHTSGLREEPAGGQGNIADTEDNYPFRDDDELQKELASPYDDYNLDSVDVAACIFWFARKYDCRMTPSKMLVILYLIYGEWLAKNNIRITKEHPHAWLYGPSFPRAYNAAKDIEPTQMNDSYATLCDTHPLLLTFIGQVVNRYAKVPLFDLTNTHTAEGTPYGICKNRNGKHFINTIIDDNDIYNWFYAKRSNN